MGIRYEIQMSANENDVGVETLFQRDASFVKLRPVYVLSILLVAT
jgi:hypothetical protein